MILACCDIGNTNIKVGVYDRENLAAFHTFSSIQETKNFLAKLQPEAAALSSVVPGTQAIIQDFLQEELAVDPYIINTNSKLHLKIEYETPETLGTDRICSAEGALNLYSKEKKLIDNDILIAADLGTACTINIIQAPDRFTGGLIAPGQGLLFKALKLHTAQLPEVSLSDYNSFIGKTTSECIASGVRHSIQGLLNYSYKKLSETGRIAGFYLTGGNAPYFLNDLDFSFEFIPHLLVSGIKSIYDLNTAGE